MREFGDGSTKSTGGEIQIDRRLWCVFFSVTARHATGEIDWESKVYFDDHVKEVGSGQYHHNKADAPGNQVLKYLPKMKQLHVQGEAFKAGAPESFFHVWTKKDK
ncbi:MAG: hypothetical protein WA708_15745 [Acidobacteriaceae bacterium]